MRFDQPSAYERLSCEKVVTKEEEIMFNETMICKETKGEECFKSYVTDFTPVEVFNLLGQRIYVL